LDRPNRSAATCSLKRRRTGCRRQRLKDGAPGGTRIALLEAKDKHAIEREKRATRLQTELSREYRRVHGLPVDAEIPPADRALLAAAVSASIEIERTTSQMVAGRARAKALKSLGFARSELRRSLRSLGLIANDAETGTNGDTGSVTVDDLKREYAARAAVGAPE
jgi:hypothetical protein